MFLPLERRPDWRNPPLITLILVIANVLIFYMWQFNDRHYERDAYSWYQEQGLDMVELKKYSEYLAQQEQTDNSVQDNSVDRYSKMLADGQFQRLLNNNEIIKPGEPGYHAVHHKSGFEGQDAAFFVRYSQCQHLDKLIRAVTQHHGLALRYLHNFSQPVM